MAKEQLYVKSNPPQIEGVDPFYVDREFTKIETGFRRIDEYVDQIEGAIADYEAREDIADLQNRVGTIEETENNAQALINLEREERQDADESFASQLLTIEAALNANTAAISVEQTARVTADEAQAQQVTTLTAEFNGNKAEVEETLTALAQDNLALAQQVAIFSAQVGVNNALIVEETTARVTADEAFAQQITTLSTDFNGNLANIEDSLTAISTATSANATSIQSLTTTVGSQTASISTLSESVDGVRAKWGVTINNNGAISGISLNSGADQRSVFKIQADRFQIEPQTAGSAISPFYVEGGTTYIENAVIKNGSITQIVSTNFPGGSGTATPVNLTLSSVPAGVPILILGTGASVSGPGVSFVTQQLRALDGNGDYVGFSPTYSTVIISPGGNLSFSCYRTSGYDASVVIMVMKK